MKLIAIYLKTTHGEYSKMDNKNKSNIDVWKEYSLRRQACACFQPKLQETGNWKYFNKINWNIGLHPFNILLHQGKRKKHYLVKSMEITQFRKNILDIF